jgi:hypothetical protein
VAADAAGIGEVRDAGRKLTTGVRSGAAGDPAIRAFRTALSAAIGSTTARLPPDSGITAPTAMS